jgi:hypothetical protein
MVKPPLPTETILVDDVTDWLADVSREQLLKDLAGRWAEVPDLLEEITPADFDEWQGECERRLPPHVYERIETISLSDVFEAVLAQSQKDTAWVLKWGPLAPESVREQVVRQGYAEGQPAVRLRERLTDEVRHLQEEPPSGRDAHPEFWPSDRRAKLDP